MTPQPSCTWCGQPLWVSHTPCPRCGYARPGTTEAAPERERPLRGEAPPTWRTEDSPLRSVATSAVESSVGRWTLYGHEPDRRKQMAR